MTQNDYDRGRSDGLLEGRTLGFAEGVAAAKAFLRTMPTAPNPNGRVDNPLMPRDTIVQNLGFNIRTSNCLRREGIRTLEDLLTYEPIDLIMMRGFGPSSLNEVRDRIERYGYQLKGDRQ